jgi:hypothetical protein
MDIVGQALPDSDSTCTDEPGTPPLNSGDYGDMEDNDLYGMPTMKRVEQVDDVEFADAFPGKFSSNKWF